jgi:hypothetical protein
MMNRGVLAAGMVDGSYSLYLLRVALLLRIEASAGASHDTHAREVQRHSYERHAYERRACEIHTHETPAQQMRARGMHAREVRFDFRK